MIFSLPNLSVWLTKKYTNYINFERAVYLTEPFVDYLLAKHGFRVIEKEYYSDGHSIFYSTVRDSRVQPLQLDENLYVENKKIYNEFF
jgi:hypothetical protein